MYNWYGPNGFSSHDSSPAIAGVSAVNAGRYSVDVITNDGCIYTGKTDSVSVGAPVLPCSLQDDAAAFNGLSNMYFTYITGSPNGGSYFLEANGAEGDAEVEFFGNALPATGVYSITSDIDLSPGTVHVNFTTLSSLWYPDPGATVYVIVVNKKITVSSCSLHIFSGTWNYGATGSFQLTQQ
jgi:hypothetical protein